MKYYNDSRHVLFVKDEYFNKSYSCYQNGEISTHVIWAYYDSRYDNAIIFPTTATNYKDLVKKINDTIVTSTKEGSVLYFDKSSKFPRFKLSQTSYKRCVKIEKADCIVAKKFDANQIALYTNCDCYVFENEYGTLCVVPESYVKSYANGSLKDFFELLKNLDSFPDLKEDPIYKGRLCCVFKTPSIYLENLINNKPLPIMEDTTLDNEVNKTFEKITEEDIETIIPMLNSSDSESVSLGLKLLSNTNVTETPYLITAILVYTFSNWCGNQAKNTVSVAQMFDTLHFSSRNINTYVPLIARVISYFDSNKDIISKNPISEDEEKLIKKYITIPAYKQYIRDCISKFSSFADNSLMPEIKYSFE